MNGKEVEPRANFTVIPGAVASYTVDMSGMEGLVAGEEGVFTVSGVDVYGNHTALRPEEVLVRSHFNADSTLSNALLSAFR